MARTDTVTRWCHDIIHGVGGLRDYKKYELALYRCEPDCVGNQHCEAAEWALKCLTNPKYRNVLEAVNERAEVRLIEKMHEDEQERLRKKDAK